MNSYPAACSGVVDFKNDMYYKNTKIIKDPKVLPKYFSRLGIFLTYKCNLKCCHCSQKGEEDRGAVMDYNLLMSVLINASRLGCRYISLSGGEPFLVYDLLEIASKTCDQRSMYCAVVTNGWWAKNKSVCVDKLSALYGVSSISISWDPWHAEYVPVDRIRTLITIAKKLKKNVDVSGCYTKEINKEESINWMIDSLGRDVCEGIEVHAQPVVNRGAAIENILPEVLPKYELWSGGCRAASNPVVLPDGVVFACCGASQDIKGISFLKLGNLTDETLFDIHKRADNNYALHILRYFGPEILLTNGYENILTALYNKDVFRNCNICSTICSDNLLIQHMKTIVSNQWLIQKIDSLRANEF